MEGALHGRRVQALRGRGVPGARGGGLPGPGERHERVRAHRAPAHRRGDLGARGPAREDHGRRAASASTRDLGVRKIKAACQQVLLVAPLCILRDLGHNASVFYAIWVIMHQFFMRSGACRCVF